MIPVEVRKIIVKSRIKGISAEEIRKVTGVSISAINNIVKNYKERGTLEGNYPGRQPTITKEQRKAMIKFVKDRPDITIDLFENFKSGVIYYTKHKSKKNE